MSASAIHLSSEDLEVSTGSGSDRVV
jgi:hypothetical protein